MLPGLPIPVHVELTLILSVDSFARYSYLCHIVPKLLVIRMTGYLSNVSEAVVISTETFWDINPVK